MTVSKALAEMTAALADVVAKAENVVRAQAMDFGPEVVIIKDHNLSKEDISALLSEWDASETRGIIVRESTPDLIDEIDAWQRETFPDMTESGAHGHLLDELAEVNEALKYESYERIAEEYADVAFLAIQAIRVRGFNPRQIIAAKHEKNRARAWPKTADARGVFHHVEAEEIKPLEPKGLIPGGLDVGESEPGEGRR